MKKITTSFLNISCTLGLLSMLITAPTEARTTSLPLKQIDVSNMSELIQAIGSNRRIYLKSGIYRMSPADQQTPTLLIKDVSNLQMIGSGLKSTLIVSDRCSVPLIDFQQTNKVRVQGIGFGRMLINQTNPLDCEPGLRGRELQHNDPVVPQLEKINQWQGLANAIVNQQASGIEIPEYTEALYANLLDQVKAETLVLPEEQDALMPRAHSMRPRLGYDFQIKSKKVLFRTGQKAQAAVFVYDRTHNLLTVLDHKSRVIMALEARNNTRFSWSQSAEWLMQKSMVPESNAPAPNGVYALGRVLKDNPVAGESFGSYRILIQGGIPTQRQILLHSRDGKQTREIPWRQDKNDENSRTLGCFLLQDFDLEVVANLIQDTDRPIALVVQGGYAKNLASPDFS